MYLQTKRNIQEKWKLYDVGPNPFATLHRIGISGGVHIKCTVLVLFLRKVSHCHIAIALQPQPPLTDVMNWLSIQL